MKPFDRPLPLGITPEKQTDQQAAVEGFTPLGLQALRELTPAEMLTDAQGLQKLLANMLAVCAPGALDDQELLYFSHLNGREIAH